MKNVFILAFLLWVNHQGYCQLLAPDPSFSGVVLKKKIAGKPCDTCRVDFAFNAEPAFSYLMTGAGPTPQRFSSLRRRLGKLQARERFQSSLHIISQRVIGITFLPNFLQEQGKKTQLYRNFGGEDYHDLEFRAKKNGRIMKPWTRLSALGENSEYTILGSKDIKDQVVLMPWKPNLYAGSFNLEVKDALDIVVRNSRTKRTIQSISVIRAEDRATNFVYYQVPLTSEHFSLNLQQILNIRSAPLKVYRGDNLNVFEKDYSAIGLVRFLGLDNNDELQYASETAPYNWQTVSSINSENGVFLVFGDEMKAGKDQDIYLRFKSQPETVHKITISVKEKPFHIPWGSIAGISILLLTAVIVGFYLWQIRSQRKLAALKQKNKDNETRLALLSGQLNPHFLFNSLNAIQGTIRSGHPDKVYTYIGNVAGFMRDVMDNGKKEFISLQEELKIETDYLTLEQERKTFSYTITVAPELEPSLIDIPPLLLQPVLENCIRHAFDQDHVNPGLSIQVSRAEHHLIVKVADNGGIMWKTHEVQDGHGLSLTKKRIAVYNEKLEGMSIRMEISCHQGSGTMSIFTFQDWLT